MKQNNKIQNGLFKKTEIFNLDNSQYFFGKKEYFPNLLESALLPQLGTIHLRRRQIFTIFASSLYKSVTICWLPRIGQNFGDCPDFLKNQGVIKNYEKHCSSYE